MARLPQKITTHAVVGAYKPVSQFGLALWGTAVAITTWQGYKYGTTVAIDNGFDPELGHFCQMLFNLPSMVIFGGLACQVPIDLRRLAAIERLLKRFCAQMLLFPLPYDRITEWPILSALKNKILCRGAYNEMGLDSQEQIIAIRPESKCRIVASFFNTLNQRISDYLITMIIGLFPVVPFLLSMLYPNNEKLQDPDFQFELAKQLAFLAMYLQIMHAKSCLRPYDYLTENAIVDLEPASSPSQ